MEKSIIDFNYAKSTFGAKEAKRLLKSCRDACLVDIEETEQAYLQKNWARMATKAGDIMSVSHLFGMPRMKDSAQKLHMHLRKDLCLKNKVQVFIQYVDSKIKY